jgi:DNA-nicking Smr family endonuclease
MKPASSPPPPLTGLDRRTSQRLARGQIEAEATFDLHGHARQEARGLLLGFLGRGRARGLRCVLVITGKGENPFTRHTLHSARFHDAPEHTGVLRSALPGWLAEPEFRALVAGFQPAHPRHGGGGAFYVWLRKKR